MPFRDEDIPTSHVAYPVFSSEYRLMNTFICWLYQTDSSNATRLQISRLDMMEVGGGCRFAPFVFFSRVANR